MLRYGDNPQVMARSGMKPWVRVWGRARSKSTGIEFPPLYTMRNPLPTPDDAARKRTHTGPHTYDEARVRVERDKWLPTNKKGGFA